MDYRANTQTNIKLNNQKIILKLLVNEGPMTRAELAGKMKSSKPTISKNVEALLKEHKLLEIGKDDNMVGKKGILLDINADYGHVLSIDLSKNKFRVVVSNLKKEWIHEFSQSLEPYFEDEKQKHIDVLKLLKEFIAKENIKTEIIMLVSIAYPGVIGHNDSVYLTNLKYREALLDQLVPYIKNVLKKQLIIKNDINLATIGVKKYGDFDDTQNLYLLSADVGVGVGIIINHQLYEGDRNAAGEVGFVLPIQQKDGGYYTLEERVCLHALTKAYSRELGYKVTFDELIEDIKYSKEKALKIYDYVLEDLSVAITNIASILDIKTVVVDGRIFELKDSMLKELNTKVNLMTPFEIVVFKTNVTKMSLKGAVTVGVESVIGGLV